MTEKIKKTFRLSKEVCSYIDEVARENDMKLGNSLEKIVFEHKSLSEGQNKSIIELSNRLDDIKTLIKKTKYSTNVCDNNVQILLEAINTLLIKMDIKEVYFTAVEAANVIKESRIKIKEKVERSIQEKTY